MTALPQKQFTGEFPRIAPHDLPPGAAQSALNVDFTQGYLQGIKSRTPVAGVNAPGAKSLFIYDSLTFSYYAWARDVDAAHGPVAQDRLYFTGDGVPKMRVNGTLEVAEIGLASTARELRKI